MSTTEQKPNGWLANPSEESKPFLSNSQQITDGQMGVCFLTDEFPKEVATKVVQEALEKTGLDPKAAKEIRKRGCFSRAKGKLKEEGLILEVNRQDDQGRWLWQLSDKAISEFNQHVSINYRAHFWFDVASQQVDSTDLELKAKLNELFDKYGKIYLAPDLMRLVHRIFSGQQGLLALRKHGGAYFVPVQHEELLQKVMDFLQAIGAQECVPIPVGVIGQGNLRQKAIAALVDNAKSRITEIQNEIKELNANPDDKLTKRKAKNRLEELQAQIEKIRTFSTALRECADNIIKQASTSEIDLSILATDSMDTAIQMAQSGDNCLAQIIKAATKSREAEEIEAITDLAKDAAIPQLDTETVNVAEQQPDLPVLV